MALALRTLAAVAFVAAMVGHVGAASALGSSDDASEEAFVEALAQDQNDTAAFSDSGGSMALAALEAASLAEGSSASGNSSFWPWVTSITSILTSRDFSNGMANFVMQASRDLTNAIVTKRDLLIQEMVVLANRIVTSLVGWLNFAFQLANVNVTQITIAPNSSASLGGSSDGTASAPTPIVPILGRTIQQEDLHFLERFVLDTVYVIKAWNKKLRTQGPAGAANATLAAP